MRQIRAVFMRGGTSKALMFHAADLPGDRAERDRLFLAAMGSPDPNRRQLDGMGGGLSSLSKICVIGPPTRADADIDYTFGQVPLDGSAVDYSGNCGNMSAAVGPFAVDEGLVAVEGASATIRIHNTNTRKIIVSRFAIEDGRAVVEGDFTLPGVAGSGAPIRLDFLDPGGAGSGKLLPTGNPLDRLEFGGGALEASMVDAANPCVFVTAASLGVAGTELPEAMERQPELLERLEAIRRAASIRMGIARSMEEARQTPSIPKVALITPPQACDTISGESLAADASDLSVRMLSIGQPHRAIPLTGALCVAVAARIVGTIVNRLTRPPAGAEDPVRIAQPSGLTVVAAAVRRDGHRWIADQATVYRTARRLMEGLVYVPGPAPGQSGKRVANSVRSA